MKKRLLFSAILLLCSATIWAQSFSVDGIKYNVTSTDELTVGVTSGGEYSGDIVIPDKVEYEGNNYSVTSIRGSAFSGCSGLTSVAIGNSVTSIYTWAFKNCSSLTSVTIGNSVTSIGGSAFSGCSSLTSVTIPNSVTSIGRSAFSGCSGLTSVAFHCESIGSWFSGISSIKEIIIGDEVTAIGDGAFSGCDGLTSVTIGNSVTSIGTQAFVGCSGLTSVTIGSSVTSIGEEAFAGCSLTSVTFHCKSIGSWFSGILSIKDIIIGDEVASVSDKAFSGCYQLTSVHISDLVAWCKISFDGSESNPLLYAHHLYLNGEEIKDLVIPDNITSIVDHAFYGCSGLTSVTIPNSVTSIGTGAFAGCSGLASITVESDNSVYDSRDNCNAIIETSTNELIAGCKNTVIPNGVTSIGSGAFSSCSSLTSVTIPNSVTSIGDYAFGGCSRLTSVTIPNSVTTIGEGAFTFCSRLISVTIPNSVTTIGTWAFSDCPSLTSVTCLAENVPATSSNAFMNSNTENATLYVPVASIEAYQNAIPWKDFGSIMTLVGGACGENVTYTFEEATGTLTISGTGAMYNYDGIDPIPWYSYNEKIKKVVITDGVTSIGNSAFWSCGLTSVTIPNSVTSIGGWAFCMCHALTSVTIPNSVTSIGQDAFKNCISLTSINVENGNTTYDSREGCNAIIESSTNTLIVGCKNTVIPNSVMSIGYAAFSECSGLTSVTIPNSVMSIGEGAFAGCSGLTSVTIPNSVTSIGNSAFGSCSSLTSVTIPNSVRSIGSSAFGGCTGLTTITVENGNTVYDSRGNCNAIIETSTNTLIAGCKTTVIPNSVTSIGNYAFAGCSGLTSVTIPNSVTSIGNYAFAYCSGLTSVTIPNSVTSIGDHAFDACTNLGSVTIPNSVTSIGNYAYTYCIGLTSVTIPNSVTSIGCGAFSGCSSLTSMSIGNSVAFIDEWAFSFCSDLKEIISEIENPFEINEYVFYADPSIYSTATLTVPHGTKAAYQATSGWNLFENIEEAMGLDPIDGDGGTDYGDDSEINNDTNLNGNVVGNIYYNIGNDDGGYSSAEGCIVINTPSADDNIDGKDIFGEDFKDHFTGIVFKIGAGSGTIKVKAETVGSMVLKVKIGENAPVVMVLNGKLEASFPYSVSEPTNVYIYGGEAASGAPMHRASGDNALKIYGISWEEEGTSISAPLNDKGEMRNDNWYTLDGRKLQGKPTQKGVYIQNGIKVVIK